jgi:hypothetical protein
MSAKADPHYFIPMSPGGDRTRANRLRAYRARGLVYVLAWVLLCSSPFLTKHASAVSITPPLLISQETSTRAIALDSLSFKSEPFALVSPYAAGPDRRTRVMLFAMNLILQPEEDLSVVTADAEDASHQHYSLTVEYIAPVPHQEWLSAIVLRLNDNLGDVGDVLIRVRYHNSNSNRVRVGIGHVGGGPADDQGAAPTPVRPFVVSGQVREDNGDVLAGIGMTLADRTDSATATATTNADGRFFFSVLPGHSVTLAPAANPVFNFDVRTIDLISGDHAVDFSGARRSYSIGGRLTGNDGAGLPGLTVNLSGAHTNTTTTDFNGDFLFVNLPAGRNYAITAPTTPYYTFAGNTFNNLSGDQVTNFPGTLRYYTISGYALLVHDPAAGVVIPISGSLSTTVTTDAAGQYSISLPAGGNYEIKPSVPFYTFFPESWVENDLTSDLTGRFFFGTRNLITIHGTLRDQESHALSGLAVNLSGGEHRTTLTDSNGNYEFAGLFAGDNYTVAPSSTAAYTFHAQNVNAPPADATIDFVGLHRLTLSGRVKDVNGNGLLGVTVNLTGSESGSTRTAADGSYSLIATATGNYTIKPLVGQDYYNFAPAEAQFNNLASAHATDFTAALASAPNPSYVLEFDGTPKTVDYGPFWTENQNLGHFFWEFWAMPGANAGGTYLLSDGYGGAHALLFGVGSLNSSEPGRYELLGDIFDGVKFDNYFGSDVGPAVGEWAHFAVGWDGQNIITYYNGVPVGKTAFAGPRRTPGPTGGGGRLLIGGSDHSNFDGRIAQVRGFEDSNPRESLPGGVEASFAPQTVFAAQAVSALGGNLLSYYFRSSPRLIADLSAGYRGVSHQGVLRGTGGGILVDCEACPPPQFAIDPTAPNFLSEIPAAPVSLPSPPGPPNGALVFDSFSRANATYTFAGHGGLGSTEGGSTGTQLWQTNQTPAGPQPFGILNARAVLLANSTAVAWVPTGSSSGNVDVRVNRYTGRWGSGIHTGLSFRVVDANNFFFAYTAGTSSSPETKQLHVGYYLNGQRFDLAHGVGIPSNWTTLRVVTTNLGDLSVYIDAALLFSTNKPLLTSATGAGLYSDSAGMGLVNRWDNFAVFNAP